MGGGNLAWADVSTDKYTTRDGIRYVLHLDKTATVAKFFPSQLNDPEKITIPSSVTFEGIKYTVTEFYLHSTVGDFLKNEKIEECTKVTSISIPATLKTFTPGKFSVDVNNHSDKFKLCYEGDHTSLVKQLPNLRYFYIDSNNPYFAEYHNQLLLSKDSTTLYCCPPGQSDPTAVIFTGIKHIGPYAFVGCKLTKFIVPASLESVDDNAFSGFSALQKFENASTTHNNKYQADEAGVLYEFASSSFNKYEVPFQVVCYPDDMQNRSEYTVYARHIAPFAFDDVTLKLLTIKDVRIRNNNGYTVISKGAFYNADFYNLRIDNQVSAIKEYAFTDATISQPFTLGNSKFREGPATMDIGSYAFFASTITN